MEYRFYKAEEENIVYVSQFREKKNEVVFIIIRG
jgi:hypothetical protein